MALAHLERAALYVNTNCDRRKVAENEPGQGGEKKLCLGNQGNRHPHSSFTAAPSGTMQQCHLEMSWIPEILPGDTEK